MELSTLMTLEWQWLKIKMDKKYISAAETLERLCELEPSKNKEEGMAKIMVELLVQEEQ